MIYRFYKEEEELLMQFSRIIIVTSPCNKDVICFNFNLLISKKEKKLTYFPPANFNSTRLNNLDNINFFAEEPLEKFPLHARAVKNNDIFHDLH